MDWMKLVVALLSGIATAIPLVIQLVKYVKAAIKEKNWNSLLALVMELMEKAEAMFENGADKKEWVLAMVKGSADSINYDIDTDALSELIDSLCEMSKVVNSSSSDDDGADVEAVV